MSKSVFNVDYDHIQRVCADPPITAKDTSMLTMQSSIYEATNMGIPKRVLAAMMDMSPGRLSHLIAANDTAIPTRAELATISLIVDDDYFKRYYIPEIRADLSEKIKSELSKAVSDELAERLTKVCTLKLWRRTVNSAIVNIRSTAHTLVASATSLDPNSTTLKKWDMELNFSLDKARKACLAGNVVATFDNLLAASPLSYDRLLQVVASPFDTFLTLSQTIAGERSSILEILAPSSDTATPA